VSLKCNCASLCMWQAPLEGLATVEETVVREKAVESLRAIAAIHSAWVSLHPTSEAPCLGWLVHVAYLVLWAVQRLLPEGSCCYKDRLAIVSNCSMLVIITSSPPRTLCICIHPSVCLSVCLCLWVTLFKTLWISFYDITGGTGLGTRNN